MWKDKILEITKGFDHPAWGLSHFRRVYNLSIELSETQKLDVDKDALYAAAYLHDIGAFNPYKRKGMDHSDVASEICEEILGSIDFPLEKISLVKDIIKSHMFYAKSVDTVESKIFHDADTLDFMGTIGITRILSLVGIDDWTPDLKSAIQLIQKFSKELPNSLLTQRAKKLGEIRKKEMVDFLNNLANQTKEYNLI